MSDTKPRGGSPAGGRAAWAWAGAVAVTVIAIDQITKQVAIGSIDPGETREVVLGIEVANVHNRGVAFGLFAGGNAPVVLFTLVAAAALAVYFARHAQRRYLWLVAGLLGGGAFANLADRLRTGSVIDFIDFPGWPTFNLADVAIVAGAAGLALILMSSGSEHEQEV